MRASSFSPKTVVPNRSPSGDASSGGAAASCAKRMALRRGSSALRTCSRVAADTGKPAHFVPRLDNLPDRTEVILFQRKKDWPGRSRASIGISLSVSYPSAAGRSASSNFRRDPGGGGVRSPASRVGFQVRFVPAY